jgi:hypothetical protein
MRHRRKQTPFPQPKGELPPKRSDSLRAWVRHSSEVLESAQSAEVAHTSEVGILRYLAETCLNAGRCNGPATFGVNTLSLSSQVGDLCLHWNRREKQLAV